MKSIYIVLVIVGVLAFLGVGLFIGQGPQPEIIVPAELITKVGPLNITNTMIATWVAMILLIGLTWMATRSMQLLPSGLQNFIEGAVEFLLGQVEGIAGAEKARKFFPFVGTLFLFVITTNWMGLIPFFNPIGKVEDVGYHAFHVIEEQAAKGEAFDEIEKFAGAKMSGSSLLTIAPRTKAEEFEVEPGQTAGAALDCYVVFLADVFTGWEKPEAHGEGHSVTCDPEAVKAAAAALKADAKAPQLLTSDGEGHGDSTHHGVKSDALGIEISGIDFPGKKFGLVIPFLRGANSDINNTLALALLTFFFIEFWGFKYLGIGYLSKFFNLKGIGSFVGILELLSEFIRIISFAFRLFGNIFAGEVLILILTFLMPFLFVDIIYGLELFVGFIQASVFALLALVFATMATESHGGDHGDEHGHGQAGHGEGAAQAHH